MAEAPDVEALPSLTALLRKMGALTQKHGESSPALLVTTAKVRTTKSQEVLFQPNPFRYPPPIWPVAADWSTTINTEETPPPPLLLVSYFWRPLSVFGEHQKIIAQTELTGGHADDQQYYIHEGLRIAKVSGGGSTPFGS